MKEKLNYENCAKNILDAVGGPENLVRTAHCATRLRFVTANDEKIDQKRLEEIDGVKGVFRNAGQLQIIIGPGAVNKVYEAILLAGNITGSDREEVKLAGKEKQVKSIGGMLQSIGEVFVPILPAIVASGLLSGILSLLGRVYPGFAASDWYEMLDLFANTAFQFLPVLIAISAAGIFGGNRYLAGVIGIIMVHPDLINAWTAAGMDASQIPQWNLLGFSIRAVGYQGHVIPVLISVWMMSKLEKVLHKHVPESADLFITPLCTVLPTAFLALAVIGPVVSSAENWMLEVAEWLITVGHGAGSMIMGAIYPLTVVCGIHHMYNVIEAGMLANYKGMNTWMPLASAANFAQGAACLAVGLKTKDAKTKSAAIPSAVSAMLGITEPAIFGINLRMLTPFICAMAGGAVGSLTGALLHIGATSYGVSGLPGFLITLDFIPEYAAMLAVSFVVTFAATWLVWKEEPKADQKQETSNSHELENQNNQNLKEFGNLTSQNLNKTETQTNQNSNEFGNQNNKNSNELSSQGELNFQERSVQTSQTSKQAADRSKAQPLEQAASSAKTYLNSPLHGYVIPLSEVPDATFAGGILGKGIGIEPIGTVITAPCDGEISLVMGSGHAIGMTGVTGAALLIHVGIDTVKMKGKGFTPLVVKGQKVKAGEELLRFDLERIRKEGIPAVTVMVVTNSAEYEEITVERTGVSGAEDAVLRLTPQSAKADGS